MILVMSILLTQKVSSAYGFGIKKNPNHTQPEIGKYAPILANNNAYYVGDENSNKIYLTFDCGYENGYTDDILEVLKAKNVVATFFITGHYLESATDLVKQMVNDGHVIGNHSNKHKDITKLNANQIKEEVFSLRDRFKELINEEMSTFYRPPAGSFDERSLKVIKDLGYNTLFWSLAYEDWNGKKINVTQEVTSHIHNGAIILMHAVSEENAKELGVVIDRLKDMGYEFSSPYELTKKKAYLGLFCLF